MAEADTTRPIHATAGCVVLEALDDLREIASVKHEHRLEAAATDAVQIVEKRDPRPSELRELVIRSREHLGRILNLALAEGRLLDRNDGPMHRLDAILANYIESEFHQLEVAEDVRERARYRWELFLANGDPNELFEEWLPDAGKESPPFIHLHLLPCVWVGKVRSDVEALAFRHVPSLSLAVLDSARDALYSPGRSITDGAVKGQRGDIVAFLRPTPVAPQLPTDLMRGLRAIGRLDGHRLLRWLVATGYSQKQNSQIRDFRHIQVAGGFSGLATSLGVSGRKSADALRASLEYLQHAQLELPHGSVGGLITWSFSSEARGRPAQLSIVLGDALLPNYVNGLPKAAESQRRARLLVPLPQQLPPLFGGPKLHASQALLQLLVMREMRLAAEEIVRSGGVQLAAGDWERLAQEAGLPVRHLGGVLDEWTDATDPAAFLARRTESPDRYTLAPAFHRELLALEGGAQLTISGREYQQRTRRAREVQQRNRRRRE